MLLLNNSQNAKFWNIGYLMLYIVGLKIVQSRKIIMCIGQNTNKSTNEWHFLDIMDILYAGEAFRVS